MEISQVEARSKPGAILTGERKDRADFYERLREVLERQYRQYELFRVLCHKRGVRLEDLKAMARPGEIHAIPSVPAEWFKRDQGKGYFRSLADFTKQGAWTVSSATTGDPSYIWRTEEDRRYVTEAFARIYRAFPSRRILPFSPNTRFLRKAGKRFALDEKPIEFYALLPSVGAEVAFDRVDFLTQVNVPKTLWTMLKTRGKGRPVLNLKRDLFTRALENAEKTEAPVVLGSSVLLLYPGILSLSRTYDLGRNVYILTGGGGWDGKKGSLVGQPIDKRRYVAEISERLNIPPDAAETHFWDTYGTAENGKAQPGSFSSELGDFVYEVGDDVKLFAVDPVHGPAKEGEKGYPLFISPYGVEGFAGACIEQQDILNVVSMSEDGSVRQFSHIHRATCAGCALEVAEGVSV